MRDPYSIYARHVLKIRPLEEVEFEDEKKIRGTIAHGAIEEFSKSIDAGKELSEQCFQSTSAPILAKYQSSLRFKIFGSIVF